MVAAALLSGTLSALFDKELVQKRQQHYQRLDVTQASYLEGCRRAAAAERHSKEWASRWCWGSAVRGPAGPPGATVEVILLWNVN
ncbi:hypothetical protein CYMTET_14643 [Cymbomonas tetramitiformis]|uniref:Uncharacterized protein n=1 Tax=Cymbomonas tetramitiformis TaxID=36881 RepID=A0AAE0GH49_9CHLO|nr:hypothetical protein CYMTET_14643 [Cymbomonas tetramitiformis]